MQKEKNKITSEFSSPLRYPGGKTRLAGFLYKAIEKNFSENEKIILVEPYAGGAGASLKLLFSGKVDRIIINDLDKAIFAFWKIVIADTDFLINKIKKVNIDIEEWKKQKEIYNNPSSSFKDLAFATLFLNRTNRSGIIEGGPIGEWSKQVFGMLRLVLQKIRLFQGWKKSKNLEIKYRLEIWTELRF